MTSSLKTFLLVSLYISASLLSFSSQSAEYAMPWELTTQSGAVISSEQYKGKPVILHFWATWCPYCKKLQPTLVELQKKYQAQGIELVAISFHADNDAFPQDELKKRGYSFLTAVQGEDVAKQYDVKGTPTTFFINKNNEIIFKTSSSSKDDPRFGLAIQEIIK